MAGDFQTIDIAEDETEEGEHAPSITVVREHGAFYFHQLFSDPLRVSSVGMSREQACKVRDALSLLLEQNCET